MDKEKQKEAVPPSVSKSTWALMIVVAIFFDVLKICFSFLDIIPGLGYTLNLFTGWFAMATFWLWFELLGAKYSKKTMLFGFAFDFIPFIGDLAETGTIVRLYIKSKAEELAKKVPGGLGEGIGAGVQGKLNATPIRQPTRQ